MTITYGEAKRRLEDEYGFDTIFSPMMGHPAGAAMDNIRQAEPDAPLLSVLLVQQGDRLPGDGAGIFLAERFDQPQLLEKGARKKYPDLWKQTFEQAADEVYAYPDWKGVFERIYQEDYQPDPASIKRRLGKDGKEKDGLKRGRHGEGPNHRALRLWTKENPELVMPSLLPIRAETEVELLSGDRVDVVYYTPSMTLAIEVKSIDSNWFDLRRGIYQCVKYREVLRAQDARRDPSVDCLMITELELDGDLKNLAKLHRVKLLVSSINT
ncbi:MAG: hypothetical protein QNJ30_14020 [Kiloniellales bacterium]|nr:hypothetical protein [Kiloniellales bacterium]